MRGGEVRANPSMPDLLPLFKRSSEKGCDMSRQRMPQHAVSRDRETEGVSPMPLQLRRRETGRQRNIWRVDLTLVRKHIQMWEEALASCDIVNQVCGSHLSQDWRIAQLQTSEPRIRLSASVALGQSKKIVENNYDEVAYFLAWLPFTIWGDLGEEMRKYNMAIEDLRTRPLDSVTRSPAPLNIDGIFQSMRELNTYLTHIFRE